MSRAAASYFELLLLLAIFGAHLVSSRIANENGRFVTVTLDERHRIRGQTQQTLFENRTYFAFKGVPYAEAPIGDLRFKPPVPKNLPNSIDALNYGSFCPQINNQVLQGSEDCLFLNVFTPSITPNRELAVIVYILGGAFLRGGIGDGFDGPDFLVEKDVVLVNMNYRINAFGFMSLGNDEYSGNMGLKDQQLVLHWVQRHIRQFGGDPNKVTLLGASAGASSIHLQMLAESSKGLFKRAILLSGTAGNVWAVSTQVDHRQRMMDLARTHNTSVDSIEDLVQWLHWAPTSLLIEPDDQPSNSDALMTNSELNWAPVVANGSNERFVVQSGLWQDLSYTSDVDAMFGYNSDERVATYGRWFGDARKFQLLDNNFEIPLPFKSWDECRNASAYAEVVGAIRHFYFGDDAIDVDSFPQLIAMLSDIEYIHGVDRSVRHQIAHSTGQTFYYRFSGNTTLNIVKRLSNATPLLLAAHGDELCYIFRCSIFPNIYENLLPESTDRKVQNYLLNLYTDFAKFGNPTPLGIPIDFQPVTTDNYQVAGIGNEGVTQLGNPNWQANGFLDALYEKHSADFDLVCLLKTIKMV